MNNGYDYIIAGGGSAGCVLASRLSENAQARVLLIEAGGGDNHPLYKVPAGFAKMTRGIGSWGWNTVPQKHMNNMSIRFTQARVIGGGSTINAQIYTRGNRLDYDGWRDLGCDGWDYESVLPYFKKSEDNDTYDNKYHSKGGLLGVSKPGAPLPICEAYFKAAEQLGIPFNEDVNGEKQEGAAYYQLTQRHARRSSVSCAFLKPALKRPNLTVLKKAQVLKILADKGKATGVEVASGNEIKKIMAEREVIISSGAIGSPRLLMLSGIGPADHLKSVGINVCFDHPQVGENLQDHLDLFVISECTGHHTYDKYAKLHWSAVAGLQYLFTRKGPVASSLFETGGFWYADSNEPYPDIQFHLGLGTGIESGVEKMRHSGVTLNTAYLRPGSRGTVRLADNKHETAPLIDPNYWADSQDKEKAIKGLKLAQKIMKQDALKNLVKREVLPGPGVTTDKDYFNYACANAKTDHHPVGTCRMGSDQSSVVDTRLRFRGIDNLRIVDASIIPKQVSCNTNAPTIMIAEKAADMIKEDAK